MQFTFFPYACREHVAQSAWRRVPNPYASALIGDRTPTPYIPLQITRGVTVETSYVVDSLVFQRATVVPPAAQFALERLAAQQRTIVGLISPHTGYEPSPLSSSAPQN